MMTKAEWFELVKIWPNINEDLLTTIIFTIKTKQIDSLELYQ